NGVNVDLAAGTATGDGNVSLSGFENVTGSPSSDVISAVSPGNGRIVFDRCGSTCDIYTVSSSGSDLKHPISNQADDYDASWSPTGNRFAFSSNRSGNYEIYTATPGGSKVRRLTNARALDTMPAWSPDGRRIAFASNRSGNY